MFKNPSASFENKFEKLVSSSKSILITAHRSQDDDSVASVLSTYNYLTKNYPTKTIEIVYSGIPISRYKTFNNYDRIRFVDDISSYIQDKDLLIFLDGSQYYRFTLYPENIGNFRGKTICIDHHSSPIDKFTLTLINTKSPSNAENIYHLFYKKQKTLDLKEIEVLLLGILGDTGNFLYIRPDQISTFGIVKRLIKEGNVNLQEFLSRYSSISIKTFEIISELVKNTKNVSENNWPPFTYAFIHRDWLEKGGFTDDQRNEASHLYMSNYLRLIEDHTWGFVLTPKPDGDFSFSLRSLPNSVNVRKIVEDMGIGGGHNRASGATFKAKSLGREVDVEYCLKQILEYLKNNQPCYT